MKQLIIAVIFLAATNAYGQAPKADMPILKHVDWKQERLDTAKGVIVTYVLNEKGQPDRVMQLGYRVITVFSLDTGYYTENEQTYIINEKKYRGDIAKLVGANGKELDLKKYYEFIPLETTYSK